MGTSHCCHHYFLLVLILFLSTISCSKAGPKRNLLDSISNPQNELERSHPKVEHSFSVCHNQNISKRVFIYFGCNLDFKRELEEYVFTRIDFAEYGNPIGDCGHFIHGDCGAPATMALVQKNCLGLKMCLIDLINRDEMFGPANCKHDPWFVVQATCSKP